MLSIAILVNEFIERYDKNGSTDFAKLMVTWKGKILTIILLVIFSLFMYKDKVHAEYINSKQYPVELSNFILQEVEDR